MRELSSSQPFVVRPGAARESAIGTSAVAADAATDARGKRSTSAAREGVGPQIRTLGAFAGGATLLAVLTLAAPGCTSSTPVRTSQADSTTSPDAGDDGGDAGSMDSAVDGADAAVVDVADTADGAPAATEAGLDASDGEPAEVGQDAMPDVTGDADAAMTTDAVADAVADVALDSAPGGLMQPCSPAYAGYAPPLDGGADPACVPPLYCLALPSTVCDGGPCGVCTRYCKSSHRWPHAPCPSPYYLDDDAGIAACATAGGTCTWVKTGQGTCAPEAPGIVFDLGVTVCEP